MIDPAITQKEVSENSAILEVDLTTLFRALRADALDALKSDNPLAALEAVFGPFSDDEAESGEEDRLLLFNGMEQELQFLVEKAREDDRKQGKGGTLILHGGHWQLEGEPNRRPDIHVKADIALEKGYTLKKGTTLTAVKVMAAGSKIHDVNRLVQTYTLPNGQPTNPADWEKVRGTAIVSNGKDTKKADIHWYQCKNIGKKEHKIK
jgi:hypothetical protein